MYIVDHVSQTPPAPVLHSMNIATAGCNQFSVTVNHGRYLLALVWMDQENNFIMPHSFSLWVRIFPDLLRTRVGEERS
jgi:hypothetical protein